jgi:two-component system chemotaxis sensor kinase CheA
VAIDPKLLLQTFLAESEENLAGIEQALLALEASPDDAEVVKTLFRAAHTLKGNALALGFPAIGELAHATEDLLAQIRNGSLRADRSVISLLLRAEDALRALVGRATAGPVSLDAAQHALVAELTAPRGASAEAALPPQPVPPPPDRPPEPPPEEPAALTLRHPAPATPSPHASGAAEARGRAPAETSRRPTLALSTLPPGTRPLDPAQRRNTLLMEGRGRTLRVDIAKLDELLNIAGEIAIARSRLAAMLERLEGDAARATLDAHREADRLYADLQDLVMKTRMVPVGGLLRQFGRVVRDLAEARGKHVRLVIEGEDVEVDTAVVEHLRDPLNHMLRNAVDHGVEPPAIRKGRGKSAEGTVSLRAFHQGGSIVVQVSDDGRGIERRRVLDKARMRGLLGPHEEPSDRELLEMIFLPGFSTADAVTEISGRGVGMDVVRRNVEAIRGTVDVSSREGEGTTFDLRLPLTLAIIQGFLVDVAGETYVVPVDSVEECVELGGDDRQRRGATGVVNLRGEALPWVRLREVFAACSGPAPARESLLVVRHPGGRAGVLVDHLIGENQIVIKSLGRLFQRVRGVAGSAILGSGRVALILDVATLLRDAMEHQGDHDAAREGRVSA